MCADKCTDMRIGIHIDTCTDAYTDTYRHVQRHMHRHVPTHVYRHVYGHAQRQVCRQRHGPWCGCLYVSARACMRVCMYVWILMNGCKLVRLYRHVYPQACLHLPAIDTNDLLVVESFHEFDDRRCEPKSSHQPNTA